MYILDAFVFFVKINLDFVNIILNLEYNKDKVKRYWHFFRGLLLNIIKLNWFKKNCLAINQYVKNI